MNGMDTNSGSSVERDFGSVEVAPIDSLTQSLRLGRANLVGEGCP